MIRALRPEDAEGVAAVIRTAFAAIAVPVDPPPSGLRVTAAEVLTWEGGAVWDEAGIAGCVLWRMREGGLYLGRLAVLPGRWGCGIARALVGAVEGEARCRGVLRVRLEVRLALASNRRLFARAGFRETALRAHEGYSEPTFVEMERVLHGSTIERLEPRGYPPSRA